MEKDAMQIHYIHNKIENKKMCNDNKFKKIIKTLFKENYKLPRF